jgi:putative transposase
MPSYPAPAGCPSLDQALAPYVQAEGLPFADILSPAEVQRALDEEGVDFGTTPGSVYTPALVLWAFLSQVLAKDKSCRAAVLRVLVLLVGLSREPCSADTGAYCRARNKLPIPFVRRLTLQVAQEMEQRVPAFWQWHGRPVFLADGTHVSMPDTEANQQAYPQPPTQKPGLGFPLARLVVLLSLSTAMVHGLALGRYQGKETGEPALFRTLLDQLPAGGIVLADRYYCSYFLLALLRDRGVDAVLRLHHCRKYDFRRGRRLGSGDHVVVWAKPARPDWMSAEDYATFPDSIEVREVRTAVTQPGFRVKSLVVVTTLVDAEVYTKDDLTDLYHDRWHVELDIRAIKVSLGMEVLRCLTPEMVEKEIWMHLLAYNLVRKVAAQAAQEAGCTPREISFTAAAQAVKAARDRLTFAAATEAAQLGQALLQALGGERVGDRPNRCEPRARKRRPKSQKNLTKPRAEARAKLLGGQRA